MVKFNFSNTIKFAYEGKYVLNYEEETQTIVITIGCYSLTLHARHIVDHYEVTFGGNIYHVCDCNGDLIMTRIIPIEEQLEWDRQHTTNL